MLNLDNTLQQKQLETLVNNSRVGFFYGLLFICLLYFIIPQATSLNFYLTWCAAYGVILAIKFLVVSRYKRQDEIPLVHIPQWLKLMDSLQVLTAASFCYLIIGFDADWPLMSVLLFWMLIISMVSGSVILYGVRLANYLCFALPLIVCSIYITFVQPQEVYRIMSVMILIYGLGVIKSAMVFNHYVHDLFVNQLKLSESNQMLESIASKDPLTRMDNRRAYEEYMEKEWDRHKRLTSIISLLIIDVDNFKEYNDYYGEDEGDTCLVRIANIIQSNLKRPGDIACRYGGEEFAIILVDTGYEGAVEVAERIRKAVYDLKIPHETSEVCPFVTVSIGVSFTVPSNDQRPETFHRQVEEQFQIAKNTGRNRISVSPVDTDEVSQSRSRTY